MNDISKVRYLYRSYGAEKSHKFVPLYGIFRQNIQTGQIEGYVEHSFTMSWDSHRVNIVSKKYINEMFAEVAKDSSKYKYFVYRLTRKGKNRKIIAQFEERKVDFLIDNPKFTKYDYRNVKYVETEMEGVE